MSEELQMQTSGSPETPVLSLRGELDLHNSPRLRNLLQPLVEKRPVKLILDLTGVSYMDSSGVGTMVEFKRRMERGGGRLILAGLQQRVRSVFEITQLDKFFTITATLEEAHKA